MSSDLIVTKSDVDKIVILTQNTILHYIFGNNYINVKTLFNSCIHQYTNFELELRIIDEQNQYGEHTSILSWNLIPDDLLIFQSYSDAIIETYATNFFIPDIKYRKTTVKDFIGEISSIFECKTKIVTYKTNTSQKQKFSITPIALKLSLEEQLQEPSNLEPSLLEEERLKIDNYERCQRCTYRFKNSALSDWRIDKTVRFITQDPNNIRLTMDLSKENVITPKYYDFIDLEIEYIGINKQNLISSFFTLIEYLNPNVIVFNINYILFKEILKFEPIVLFENINILTNNLNENYILQQEPAEYTNRLLLKFNEKIFELYECYSSNSSTNKNSSITKQLKFNCLNDNYIINVDVNSISKNLLKYTKKDIKKSTISGDNLFDITILSCLTTNDNVYYVNDAYCLNSKIINNKPFSERYSCLSTYVQNSEVLNTFLNIKLLPILTSKANIFRCKLNSEPFNASTNYIYKQITDIELTVKISYNLKYNNFELFVLKDAMFEKNREFINFKVSDNYENDNRFIKFISIYKQINTLTLADTWDKSYFSEQTVQEITDLINLLKKEPAKYSNSILTIKYANIWIPYKLHLNDASIKLSTYLDSELAIQHIMNKHDLLCNDVKNSYVISKLDKEESYKGIYDTITNLLEQYVIEIFVNPNVNANNTIDASYINTKNIKLNNNYLLTIINDNYLNSNLLFSLGNYYNIDIISNEFENLSNYTKFETFKNIIPKFKLINKSINKPFINAHKLNLVYNDEFISILNKQFSNIYNSFDCIYIQDVDSILSIKNIIKFINCCNQLLNPNGKIILKFIDSEFIGENSNIKMVNAENLIVLRDTVEQNSLLNKLILNCIDVFGINVIVSDCDLTIQYMKDCTLKQLDDNLVFDNSIVVLKSFDKEMLNKYKFFNKFNIIISNTVKNINSITKNFIKVNDYYIIFKNKLNKTEKLLMNYLEKMDYNEYIFKRYVIPDSNYENVIINKLFNSKLLNLFTNSQDNICLESNTNNIKLSENSIYSIKNICQPITKEIVLKHVLNMPIYSQFIKINDYLQAFTVCELQKNS